MGDIRIQAVHAIKAAFSSTPPPVVQGDPAPKPAPVDREARKKEVEKLGLAQHMGLLLAMPASVWEAFKQDRAKPRSQAARRAAGLTGKDLEELQRGFGSFKQATPRRPFTDAAGTFILPFTTPTEARARAAKVQR